MKTLMLGNEAAARGLYESGCRFVSSYPGTPSTEITEAVAEYDEIYAEWAPNEKVALEAAIGASFAGGRSFCAMKHVGLNVAADPLFIGAYTGVNGGLVIGVADDPGMHSSQNEQDSRHYAKAAKLPMLEPSDSADCLNYIKTAFEISEKYDTPVIVRFSTRVSHSQSIVTLSPREDAAIKDYTKNASKHVMMPSYARGRHVAAEKHLSDLIDYTETSALNIEITNTGSKYGIITSGVAFNYAYETFGESASYLKLGVVHPLSEKLLLNFSKKYEHIIIIEELDPFIETFCRSIGIVCDGKNKLPVIGEYSQELLASVFFNKTEEYKIIKDSIPPRPPVLCAGCPHRGIFYLFNKMKLYVSGDIGCYTLGANEPLNSMDTTLCMGASISALHGFLKIRPEYANKSIAVIGDSTFMHSGVTGLINTVYNKGNSVIVIVDNSITGMTGHQQNPCTGYTLKGESVYGILPEDIARAAGIENENIYIVDPYDLTATETALKNALSSNKASVIISRRPCALLKNVKKEPAKTVDNEKCKSCRACMKIGCPCISMVNSKANIDNVSCTGCGVCSQLCRFGAIN